MARRFKLLYDNLDDRSFPREGRVLQLDYFASMDSFDATTIFRKSEINYLDNLSIGGNTFSFAGRYARVDKGNLTQFNRYTLGGFLQLSGYRPGDLFGEAVALARLDLQPARGRIAESIRDAACISARPSKQGESRTRQSNSPKVTPRTR